MKEPLAYYRRREGSISTKKRALIKYNMQVYRKVLGYSKVKATLYLWLVFMPTYFAKKVGVWLRNIFF